MSLGTKVIAGAVLLWGSTLTAASGSAEDNTRSREAAAQAAETLLQRSETLGQRALEPRFRAALAVRLAALPQEELEAKVSSGGGIAPLALGDSSTQLIYTPVTPCRLIDTRLAGGPLAAGAVRDYKVAGTGLQNQGGNPAGCGVPFGPATAAMINFVVVSPVGPGNLRAWAFSTPPEAPPAASIINYPFGLTLANGVAVPICDPAHTTCPGLDLKVQADVNGAHLVADVLGYFERFPKEEVKTFTVPDFGDAATPGIAGTCTHVTGTSVTINATTAGKVIVHGLVVAAVGHLQGGGDEALYTFVGNSTTDCAGNSSLQAVPSAMPTAVYNMTLPVVRVFDVAAGSYTYYLNALVAGPGGPASGDFANAGQSMIEATFVPN